MSINKWALMAERKAFIDKWENKFQNRFGFSIVDEYWDELNTISEEQMKEIYQQHLDDEFNNKFGGA